jgi:hypothetical protein
VENRHVRELLDYLAERGIPTRPGLDDEALGRLDEAVGIALPEPVRALYRACGGMNEEALEHLPMRLVSPDELMHVAKVNLTEVTKVYSPAITVYMFTDDNSNWAGIHHSGPLSGLATVLAHDELSLAPRWRDLASLLHHLVEAGRRMHDWDDDFWADFARVRTDYPLTPDSPEELVAEAGPLALLHLDRFRASVAGRSVLNGHIIADMQAALYLLPPGHPDVLAEMLRSPHQFVRYTALSVIRRHRAAELTTDVAAYARACLAGDIAGGGHPYSHLLRAYAALRAIGASAQAAEVLRDCPADWTLPDAEWLDRTLGIGPTVGEP